MSNIVDFINKNWDGTLRYNPPKDSRVAVADELSFDARKAAPDADTLIPLPKPYTVPSIKDFFNELYYWDTYFTNVGLILSGKVDYARDNVENIAYLIDVYGYMPNGNRTYYLTRSQPPFFSAMVRDVYENTGDREWLAKMYPSVAREYSFWQEKRMTPSGLNRYYHNFDNSNKEALVSSAETYARRLKIEMPTDGEAIFNLAENVRVVCESGWDCNSRFGMRTFDYNWIDLNCLLYGMEDNMAYFAQILGNGEHALWLERRDARRELLNKLCWNEKMGMFCDYDYVKCEQSDFVSCASLYALWVGLCTDVQAAKTVKLLEKLEQKHGLACCEPRDDIMDLQWDYPHGWACLHYIAIAGLLRYGYTADARRIAEKYSATVERNFEETGNIWEHYDTVSGKVSVTREKTHQITMMGWSAGIYLYSQKMLGKL